jgi:prefoldin beta subunit
MDIQRQIEAEAAEIKKIEQEYTKVVAGKRSLVDKKTENEMVLQELNLVTESEATIYKLVGPILAKQDLAEAKTNVKTRLDYITKEVDRMDHLENEFNGKVEDKRKTIMRLNNEGKQLAQQMQGGAQKQ